MEPPRQQFRCASQNGVIENSYLEIGFHTPGVIDEDTYALEILSLILGHGRGSRLYQNVKEAGQLVNTITAYDLTLPTLGMFIIEARTIIDKIRQAEDSIISELAGKGFEEVKEFPEQIRQVTGQDILQAACSYFNFEKKTEGILRYRQN